MICRGSATVGFSRQNRGERDGEWWVLAQCVGENEEGAWASSAWGLRSFVAHGAVDLASGAEQRGCCVREGGPVRVGSRARGPCLVVSY
jgi:hypothetical protein